MSIQTVDSQVPFNSFVKLCEKISQVAGKEKKKEIFKRFLFRWREKHKQLHGEAKTSDSLFPLMRFMLPQLDKDRLSYGLKEVVLAKYYIDVLNISKESTDALRLLNYRAPNSGRQDAGDFASVAYVVLKNRCPDKGSFSIADVNQCLDDIAKANSEKRRDLMKKEIQYLIKNSSALEQKWIIRILLKEMKLGMNENTILPLFHPDAQELYNICNSLSKVCLDLHDINTKLNEKEIILMSPFRPMLGMRSTIENIEKLMNHQEFFIETKIDGERIQLHKKDDQYAYFSRNANNFSGIFGSSKLCGTFTPYITMLFKPGIQTCILDGEMVAFNTETKHFVLKGSNVDVKAELKDGLQPCFIVFDVLMVNGENLANTPLKDRLLKLPTIFQEMLGRFEIVHRTVGQNKEDIINAINNAIDKREEGIVVKDPLSLYKPSKRKDSGWFKLKPEYVDSLSDDLDLVIIGGQYGSGHRGGMISHFLLGVAITTKEGANIMPTCFKTFGKVGSGYTDKELSSLCSKLDRHWQKFDPKNLPDMIQFTPGCKEKPDVWIEPQNSVIVQIKAAEIIASDKYACGYTVRFPRLESFRHDKNWYECMTTDDIDELREVANGKLTSKHAEHATSDHPNKKKRRLEDRASTLLAIGPQFKAANVAHIKESCNAFKGKEFCVINGPINFSKQLLEEKISEMNGVFVQNPGEGTYCVVAEKVNFRVNCIISSEKIDVVKASWLLDCFEKKSLVSFRPKDMLYSTYKTKALFQLDFDKFGDHYSEDTNTSNLSDIFRQIKETDELSNDAIIQLEERYITNSVGLFRRHKLFLATKLQSFASLEFRFYGGTLCDHLDDSSHVLVDESDPEKITNVRQQIQNLQRKPYIITASWVRDCIDSKRILAEGPYEPE